VKGLLALHEIDTVFLALPVEAHRTMLASDAEAVWVMMSWSMREPIVRAVPSEHILMLDLGGGAWRWSQAFYGRPWVWCVIHNFGGMSGLFGERRDLPRRLLPLLPGGIGLLVWGWFAHGARRIDTVQYPTLVERLVDFENNILGGWQDWSETMILGAFALIVLFLSFHALPLSRPRWSRLDRHDRIFYAFIALNLWLIPLWGWRGAAAATYAAEIAMAVAMGVIAYCPQPEPRPPGSEKGTRDASV
jgi:hypothetical protein